MHLPAFAEVFVMRPCLGKVADSGTDTACRPRMVRPAGVVVMAWFTSGVLALPVSRVPVSW
jgi:hypothetical protein